MKQMGGQFVLHWLHTQVTPPLSTRQQTDRQIQQRVVFSHFSLLLSSHYLQELYGELFGDDSRETELNPNLSIIPEAPDGEETDTPSDLPSQFAAHLEAQNLVAPTPMICSLCRKEHEFAIPADQPDRDQQLRNLSASLRSETGKTERRIFRAAEQYLEAGDTLALSILHDMISGEKTVEKSVLDTWLRDNKLATATEKFAYTPTTPRRIIRTATFIARKKPKSDRTEERRRRRWG
jgi:hypothetical protein